MDYGFCRKQNLQCLVQSRVQCVIQSCDQLTHNNYTLKKMKALPEDSWMLARVLSQTGVQDSTSMYKNIIGKDVFSYASWSVILSLSTKCLIFTHCADEKVDDTKYCKPFGRKENLTVKNLAQNIRKRLVTTLLQHTPMDPFAQFMLHADSLTSSKARNLHWSMRTINVNPTLILEFTHVGRARIPLEPKSGAEAG